VGSVRRADDGSTAIRIDDLGWIPMPVILRVTRSDGDVIEPWDLHIQSSAGDPIFRRLLEGDDLMPLRELQSRYIRLVLDSVKGHQLKAAQILGVNPKTIYRSLKPKD